MSLIIQAVFRHLGLHIHTLVYLYILTPSMGIMEWTPFPLKVSHLCTYYFSEMKTGKTHPLGYSEARWTGTVIITVVADPYFSLKALAGGPTALQGCQFSSWQHGIVNYFFFLSSYFWCVITCRLCSMIMYGITIWILSISTVRHEHSAPANNIINNYQTSISS